MDDLVLCTEIRYREGVVTEAHRVGDDDRFGISFEDCIASVVMECWSHIESILSLVVP